MWAELIGNVMSALIGERLDGRAGWLLLSLLLLTVGGLLWYALS